MAQEQATPFRASDEDWSWIEDDPQGRKGRCLLELRARVEALEAAAGTTQLQPEPPTAASTGGVTVEELMDVMDKAYTLTISSGSVHDAASYLLQHPRVGPLLSGKCVRRVELSEEPPYIDTPSSWSSIRDPYGLSWQEGHASGWAAARAEVARQQGDV